jgi:hypothetical protein
LNFSKDVSGNRLNNAHHAPDGLQEWICTSNALTSLSGLPETAKIVRVSDNPSLKIWPSDKLKLNLLEATRTNIFEKPDGVDEFIHVRSTPAVTPSNDAQAFLFLYGVCVAFLCFVLLYN